MENKVYLHSHGLACGLGRESQAVVGAQPRDQKPCSGKAGLSSLRSSPQSHRMGVGEDRRIFSLGAGHDFPPG